MVFKTMKKSLMQFSDRSRLITSSSCKVFVLLLVLLSGCTQIDNPEEEIKGAIQYELFTSFPKTRTVTEDGVEVNWVADDMINVTHSVAGSSTWIKDGIFSIGESNIADGKFTGTLSSPLDVDTSYDWYVLYPSSNDYQSPDGENRIVIGNVVGEAQEQEGNSNRSHLAGRNVPLYGKALNVPSTNKPTVALNQLLAVVKIHVTNTKNNKLVVTSASFTASEDIVGEYSVDFTQDAPLISATGGGTSSTAELTVKEGAPIEKDGSSDYYVVIKPFTAPAGSQLKVNINGIEKAITIGEKPVNFYAGKIKTINFTYDANPVIIMTDDVLEINEETVWEQVSETACKTQAIIQVSTGQRLLFRHGNYHLANKLTILGYENSDKNSEPVSSVDLVLPSEIMVIPDGVNYIRLISTTSGSGLTPTMCEEDNFHVINVEGNSAQSGTKLWDWNHSSSSLTQGMACANGYCFQAFADGYVDIWEIGTKTYIESVFFPVASDAGVDCMHLNNLCFGDKYNAEDTFGVLWGNNESIGSSMVGVRVTREGGHFVFTKVAEVAPPYMDNSAYIADDQYIDFNNKRMVQVVYKKNEAVTIPRTGFSDTVVSYYSYDELKSGATYSLLGRFEFPIMWAMQGGRVVDNLFYLVSGVEGSANCINIFNLNTHKCTEVIDLSRDCFGIIEEPQGLEFYQNKTYLSTINGFYEINI